MTKLQLAKALDDAIDASFKSTEGTIESRIADRVRIREFQNVLRQAHKAEKSQRNLRIAAKEFLASVRFDPVLYRQVAPFVRQLATADYIKNAPWSEVMEMLK